MTVTAAPTRVVFRCASLLSQKRRITEYCHARQVEVIASLDSIVLPATAPVGGEPSRDTSAASGTAVARECDAFDTGALRAEVGPGGATGARRVLKAIADETDLVGWCVHCE